MAVPDSSPRASLGVPIRFPQMLEPTDRTLSPLVASASPWGRVSGPAGLAPEALQERECSYRGFLAEFYQRGMVHVSTGIGDVSAGFGDAHATDIFRVRCIPGGVAMRRAPEPGPIRGDLGELFVLF
jgi:hypothetical protein